MSNIAKGGPPRIAISLSPRSWWMTAPPRSTVQAEHQMIRRCGIPRTDLRKDAQRTRRGTIAARNPSFPRFTPNTGNWLEPSCLTACKIEPSPPSTMAKSAATGSDLVDGRNRSSRSRHIPRSAAAADRLQPARWLVDRYRASASRQRATAGVLPRQEGCASLDSARSCSRSTHDRLVSSAPGRWSSRRQLR